MRQFGDVSNGRFLQASRQCFASYRGKLMGEVTRVAAAAGGGGDVASRGAIKVGSLDFRAPGNLSMLAKAGICAGVSHTREAEGYLEEVPAFPIDIR